MNLTTFAATSAGCSRPSPARPRGPIAYDIDVQLGPMAAKLQQRRARRAARRRSPATLRPDARFLASDDGSVQFVVWACNHGLYVERTQRRSLGAHLTQSMLFGNAGAFLRWCEADPIRFDYPMLHGELRRIGHDHDDALC